jgi:ribosomal-protein-alanine N-acetyltransferase
MMEWSKTQSNIETERLILRPFIDSDAEDIKRLAGDKDVYDMTFNIPHPYTLDNAINWIENHPSQYSRQENIVYAITLKKGRFLVGAINLAIREIHNKAEFGYWIGKEFWNNGYCTEALNAILNLGFNKLELNRIEASHILRNPASGKVMIKNGMKHEGCMRKCMKKGGEYEDLVIYSILREEYVK